MKKIVRIMLFICALSVMLCAFAMNAMAEGELPMPTDNTTHNTLMVVLLCVLVALFLFSIIFLAVVLIKTGKKK